MPGRGTPHAAFRLDPRLWARFERVAQAAGTERTAVLRAFIAWYVNQPGAPAPTRPADSREDGAGDG